MGGAHVDRRTWRARVLVWAGGGLSNPAWPDIAGRGSFRGPAFHSGAWDHGVDLRGKRVAVIGTGASAIQFVPRIQPLVAHLDLYQRTPSWILPRPDRPISGVERALFRRVPLAQRLVRWSIYWRNESTAFAFTVEPRLVAWGERGARRHLEHQVADPELRRRLTPGYALGCKRVLLSDDYYPAVAQPNVDLVTDAIREIVPDGVRTADGEVRPADVIVFGTGYQIQNMVPPGLVTGRGGRDLADAWSHGMEAYKGTAVAGFPNLFLLLGPNTALGHNSMIHVIESQTAYLLDALHQMRAHGWDEVEVRADAQSAYNAELQERLARTVWQTGCRSWYLDARGRNTTIWPSFTFEFRRRTRRFDADVFHARAAVSASGA